MHGIHAATSKVENSAQGSSCKLKFVHGKSYAQHTGRVFYALLFMLTVVYAEYHKLSLYTILSVIMLNVVMLSVVAPLI